MLVRNKAELLGLLLRAAHTSRHLQGTAREPDGGDSKGTAQRIMTNATAGVSGLGRTQHDATVPSGVLGMSFPGTDAFTAEPPESYLDGQAAQHAPHSHEVQQQQDEAQQHEQASWLQGQLQPHPSTSMHHATPGWVKAGGGKKASRRTVGVSKAQHQRLGHSEQHSRWTRPGRGHTRKSEVADLLNKVVEIPGHIFGVDEPGVYYTARVVAPDTSHAHAAVVRMVDNKAKFYFPVGQVRDWLRDMQERHQSEPLSRQPSDSSDMSAVLAAEVLALMSGDPSFKPNAPSQDFTGGATTATW